MGLKMSPCRAMAENTFSLSASFTRTHSYTHTNEAVLSLMSEMMMMTVMLMIVVMNGSGSDNRTAIVFLVYTAFIYLLFNRGV